MRHFSAWSRWIGSVTAALWLAGCAPDGGGPEDETKEAHYIAGRNLVTSMDYKGAEAAFKKAIEVNPRSSVAHYDLGLLYANKLNEGASVTQEEREWNYIAAIYHLAQFLRLSPKSKHADQVREQVMACKFEVTKTVPATFLSANMQRDFERLSSTNSALSRQIEQLKLEMAQQSYAASNRYAALQTQYVAAVAAANAAKSAPSPSRTDSEPAPAPRVTEKDPVRRAISLGDKPASSVSAAKKSGNSSSPQPGNSSASRSAEPSAGAVRYYKAQPGETFAAIARKHRVSLDALRAANPGIEPRRLRAGQTLKIPGGK